MFAVRNPCDWNARNLSASQSPCTWGNTRPPHNMQECQLLTNEPPLKFFSCGCEKRERRKGAEKIRCKQGHFERAKFFKEKRKRRAIFFALSPPVSPLINFSRFFFPASSKRELSCLNGMKTDFSAFLFLFVFTSSLQCVQKRGRERKKGKGKEREKGKRKIERKSSVNALSPTHT